MARTTVFGLLLWSTQAAAASPADSLAEAWAHIGIQQFDQATESLSEAPEVLWSGHFEALRGISALGSSNAPDAVQALQAALKDPHLRGPIRDQARLHLARALLAIEDPEGANTLLKPMLKGALGKRGALPSPGGVDPGDIRWWLSHAATQLDQGAKARAWLEAIWTHNPTSHRAKPAFSALVAGGYKVDPATPHGTALYESRIRTLQRLFMNKEALVLREALGPSHPLREPHAFAGAVFKAKDYARAAELLQALGDPSADEGILLALAQVRSGDATACIQTYKRLAGGASKVAELATYKLGYMAFDQARWAGAILAFDRYLSRYPSGKYADASMWFTGLSRLRMGETRAANKTFAQLEVSHPGSSLRAGAVYWQAQTSKDDVRRSELLSIVVQTWPKTGYAWFASGQLGITFPAKVHKFSTPQSTVIDRPAWHIGKGLTQSGLLPWARPHLESLAANSGTLNREQTIGLATALIEAGSYRTAKRLVHRWCGNPARATNPALIQACWPRPSGQTVQALATEAGLPAYLPFAIMTAESALDPGVTSPAGARGLMQLMPSLAERLHGDLWPDTTFDADRMYSPGYNATLGTTELIRLAEQFGGLSVDNPLPMVIAGYNGGADSVIRWVDGYNEDSSNTQLTDWDQRPVADVWSEFIGYGETRKYVRRVLGYLQVYRLAYGDQPSDQAAQAP